MATTRKDMSLLRLNLMPADASVDAVKVRYNLKDVDIDEAYGLRRVANHVYAVMVTDEAAERITRTDPHAHRQANPRVSSLSLRQLRKARSSA